MTALDGDWTETNDEESERMSGLIECSDCYRWCDPDEIVKGQEPVCIDCAGPEPSAEEWARVIPGADS